MNDTGSFIAAVLRELAASTAVILAAWGALGGATNALTTKMRLRDALRHILLGGLIAAGMGSLSMAVITALAQSAARGDTRRRSGGFGGLSRRGLRTGLHRDAARPPAPRQRRRRR